ncbi:sulfide/dihydroorotate dehydrogenase-like FAD/NAD-binding protein [bacterium]|nr:sulfide/dihydroorotate dehydrogenase-like FAD/NAD-binding protein [bacterium]NIN92167.1 sulfide/dihydroorotate dehydrogenase-like FAD/NAD-binding protein [bacterium]NIO18825.1 sulfide/dihydroorotate dehydrogenase-like FAD/NAD-binding protein [bacterium]NIO73909.1 sulfide/dihydroorotate dehydrogenase-like FAD/NAD-binding protein [bacterium]
MYEILKKQNLAPSIKEFLISSPEIARKAQPGQFVVVRIDERGERIPLTIAEYERDKGTITIVIQEAGKSTYHLGRLDSGDTLSDVIGPLGRPTHMQDVGTVVCVGGGVGIPPIYPLARGLREIGNRVISIIGARTRELVIWEDKIASVSDEVHVTTDDGSYGRKGFVSNELQRLIEGGRELGLVFAVGPTLMMRAVSEVTRPYKIRTMVSLNPIMVDATGMCGVCRVSVGGETKFVCVDGPDFDAHQVDFNQLLSRQRIYIQEEKKALQRYNSLHKHGKLK